MESRFLILKIVRVHDRIKTKKKRNVHYKRSYVCLFTDDRTLLIFYIFCVPLGFVFLLKQRDGTIYWLK